MKTNSLIITVNGKRRSGKSTILHWIENTLSDHKIYSQRLKQTRVTEEKLKCNYPFITVIHKTGESE